MNRLRELREEKGLTQKEFGDKVNASQNTVSQWESGKRNIEVDRLLQFAEYFQCTTDYILGNSDQKNGNNTVQDESTKYRDAIALMHDLTNEEYSQVIKYMAFLKTQR